MQVFAIVVILFGTVLASGFIETNADQINIKGLIFGILAALCYAIFLLLNGKLGNDYPPLKKSALMITGACILIFVVLPPQFLINGALSGSLLKWGIILAVFGTFIPPICFAAGIPKIGLTLSSILSSVELPVAVMMSSLILHEEVNLIRWLGVIIIISAVIIPNLENIKKQNIFTS